jgi:hypothetical protein
VAFEEKGKKRAKHWYASANLEQKMSIGKIRQRRRVCLLTTPKSTSTAADIKSP